MILWFILTAMIVVAAVGLTIPVVRRYDARRAVGSGNVAVLKDQLADLDKRAASEAMPDAEVEGLRTEIKRRILAEGPEVEAPARPISERALVFLALGLAAIVVMGAASLYLMFGRPDLSSTPGIRAAATSRA
jgi:cytochrome c-type biogenesis protein CcmH